MTQSDFIKAIISERYPKPDVDLSTRDELLAEAAERFTTGPSRLILNNSTAVLLVPADFNPERSRIFIEKIWMALEYATAFVDDDNLNALQYLPPEAGNHYMTLGLYLYLADACSHLNRDMTILRAMRTAEAGLKIDDEVDRDRLLTKVLSALDQAKLLDDQKRVVTEWAQTGAYTIAGERHFANNGDVYGSYAELARDIAMRQQILGMNLPISYALGNKPYAEQFESDTDALKYTTYMVKNKEDVSERIHTGGLLREYRMRRNAHAGFHDLADMIDQSIFQHAEHQKLARAVFEHMPDDLLRLLITQRYHVVYTPSKNISDILPEGNLPGLSPKGTEETRGSKGARLDRYYTLFMSHGLDKHEDKPRVFTSDEESNLTLAQTGIHELVHVAIDIMNKHVPGGVDRNAELMELASALGKAVREEAADPMMTQMLTTIDTNNLSQVLNSLSGLYENYRKKKPDTSREEVVCNAYALYCTELKGKQDSLPEKTRAAFTALVEEVAAVVKRVNEHSGEEHVPQRSVRQV
ncbi:MAG: hypothetical protein EB060_02520 [Proteobacteria bacterium]|nr:hypothetical protein [Pseudomonadota bacterium]